MRSEPAALADPAYGIFVAADMEFLMDILYVRVHRMVADREVVGVPVRQTLSCIQ